MVQWYGLTKLGGGSGGVQLPSVLLKKIGNIK
jgi:hypothetical protein